MTLTIGLELEDFLGKHPEVSRELAQAWLDWDDAEQATRGEDDHGHCWALPLFPPSRFPSEGRRASAETDQEGGMTSEQVRERFARKAAAGQQGGDGP